LNEIICQIKRPFFLFLSLTGREQKKKETHLIFSVCSHMKDHNKFLICLLRACGLSLLSQEDIDDPKCNKKDSDNGRASIFVKTSPEALSGIPPSGVSIGQINVGRGLVQRSRGKVGLIAFGNGVQSSR
jgi:hypothetical protein